MTTPDEIAQVLEDAADVLLVRGRSIGTEDEAGVAVCVLGAIGLVVMDEPYAWASNDLDGHPAVRSLSSIVEPGPITETWLGVDPDVVRLFTWNDRTRDDDKVRDALLLCAKDWRNQA